MCRTLSFYLCSASVSKACMILGKGCSKLGEHKQFFRRGKIQFLLLLSKLFPSLKLIGWFSKLRQLHLMHFKCRCSSYWADLQHETWYYFKQEFSCHLIDWLFSRLNVLALICCLFKKNIFGLKQSYTNPYLFIYMSKSKPPDWPYL